MQVEVPCKSVGTGPRGRRKVLLVALAMLAFVLSCSLGQDLDTAALLRRSSKSKNKKVLVQARGYELVMFKGKGKVPLPKLKFRKIPAELVTFAAGGTVESGLDKKEVLGFPFTTQNSAILQVGLPRFGGSLRLRMEDPRTSPDEDAQGLMEALYVQQAAGLGELTGRVRSNGEWSAGISRDVEDIGHVRGSLNSQLDWSVDLDQDYPAVKGITPSASYGVTQDGIRARVKVDGPLSKNVHATYSVQNTPGKYGPVDMLHDARLVLSSGSQALHGKAVYDRKFAKNPLRGSLAYSVKTGPATLETSVDYDNYRLAARTPKVGVAAALSRKADENGNRAAEVEMKAGKIAAVARLDAGSKQPRVQLNVDV